MSMRSSHLRRVPNTGAPQSMVQLWNRGGAKVWLSGSPRRARRQELQSGWENFLWSIRRDHRPGQRLGPGGGQSSIAGRQRPQCGRVGRGGSPNPPRPIGGAGARAVHPEGALVVAGRRGRPQVTSAAPSDGLGARAATHATATSQPAPEYGLDQGRNRSRRSIVCEPV
jgi:hypothetical protein